MKDKTKLKTKYVCINMTQAAHDAIGQATENFNKTYGEHITKTDFCRRAIVLVSQKFHLLATLSQEELELKLEKEIADKLKQLQLLRQNKEGKGIN